jgi:hypothetical protein
MRVPEENILPIRLIRISQLLSHQALLILIHALQRLLVLLVEPVIAVSKRKTDEDLASQRDHDADLATNVARCLGCLESLRAEDVADAKSNKCHRVDDNFLAVTSDIGRVPCKEKHEGLLAKVSGILGGEDLGIGDVQHQKYCSNTPRRGAHPYLLDVRSGRAQSSKLRPRWLE